jgi:hypothetical protein
MSDLGDRALGSTVTFQFTTSVNGVPTALAGSPVVSVYGSNSSTPITAGVTWTGSYNSTTGLNNVSIVATSGNGFADGRDYSAVITTGTLAGISMVGYQIGTFSISLGNVANLSDQAISAAAGVTFPSSVASPTNITGGTITTVTNLTNAPTAGDLTATMKTSVQTASAAAITAAEPVTANVTQIGGNSTAATNLSDTTQAIGRGTVGSSSSTTSVTTSAFAPAGAAANQFAGRTMLFDAATATTSLQGQATVISASSNAAHPTFTVAALTTAPASGDSFSVI